MKRALALLMFALFSAGALVGADIGIFQGDASVPIGNDGPIVAKIKARNEALKNAVRQAVTQSVPPKIYRSREKEIEKNILKKAGDYVQSFEILDSGVLEGTYKLSLEARINLEKLNREVLALGGGPQPGDEPKARVLLVTTTRWLDDENPWPALWQPIASRMEMVNLFPVDESKSIEYLKSVAFQRYAEKKYEETFDLGPLYDVRYALVFRSIIVSQAGAGCPSLGTALFLDLAQRKVLAEVPYNFREEVGCEEAAQIAAKTLFALLTEKLQGKGIFDQAPTVATELSVIGLRSYRDTTELTALMRSIPDLKSIGMHSFSTGGRVIFRITFEGPSQTLVEAVTRLRPVGFKLEPRVTRDDSLLFEAEY